MPENTTHKTGCPECHEESCACGKRNRYFKGKNMAALDFRLEQRYGMERRRLLNRAIAGWGVVYGFEISVDDSGNLTCGPGLALDQHGREIYRPVGGSVTSADIYVNRSDNIGAKDNGSLYLLQAHYAERPVDQVRLSDGCGGCDETEWNHVCETVVYSLKPCNESCSAGEAGCPEPTCDKTCGKDGCNQSCALDRGPHKQLCDWLGQRDVRLKNCSSLCNWHGMKVALNDPVPLAWVTVKFDECGHPLLDKKFDDCTPRRLVKSNDLLFDLVRGCDLTHISNVSWSRCKEIEWRCFKEMFDCNEVGGEKVHGREGKRHHSPAVTNFTFHFSKPVRTETLTLNCISMTALVIEDRTGWVSPLRVPVLNLEKLDEKNGYAMGARVVVDADWYDDEICDRTTVFRHEPVTVEIEIRGDLIIDCNGQAVDANTRGLSPAPTGNGSPGGTYLWSFAVKPLKPESES